MTAIVAETSATASTFVISDRRAKLLISVGSGAAIPSHLKGVLTFGELASRDVLTHDVLLVAAANRASRGGGVLGLDVLLVDGRLVLIGGLGLVAVVAELGRVGKLFGGVGGGSVGAADLGLVDDGVGGGLAGAVVGEGSLGRIVVGGH